jgi:hypothetical protein
MSEQNPAPPPTDSPLLFIYDATSRASRIDAWFRGDGDMFEQVRQVPITAGLAGLQTALAELVKKGETYQHCVIDADGGRGMIYFNGEPLNFSTMLHFLHPGLHLENIFPLPSRIYFNGTGICDVPIRLYRREPRYPDPNGNVWDFLDAAAQVFLKRGGGVTFASSGMTVNLGPRHHLFSNTCWSLWKPGGQFVKHYTT